MEGVAGIGISAQFRKGQGSSRPGMRLAFQHHESCPFSEVQTSASGIEGTASLRIQDHEAVEAVEMVAGEAFRTSCHNHIGLAGLYEFASEDDGVGGTGAGRGYGSCLPENAEIR